MRFDGIFLAGIGTALPPAVSVQQAIGDGLYDQELAELSGMTAVRVAGDTPAPDLAVTAALRALAQAGHPREDFGSLVHCATHHQGPDGWSAPHYVLRHTLATPVSAIELRQGCLGMLAGLELAAQRLSNQQEKQAVLLTAADNFSTPLVDRWRASPLFLLGDGAASVVVSRREGFARFLSYGAVSDPGMEELHRGGEQLFPPGITVGRSLNFDERSRFWRQQWMKGIAPPSGDLGALVSSAVTQALDEAGLSLEKIRRVCHVAYSRGALHDLFLDPLDLSIDRGVWEFSRGNGHTGASDPFIGLQHLWTSGQVSVGDHVLLVGAAPGMEVGCAVIEIVTAFEPHPAEGFDDTFVRGD